MNNKCRREFSKYINPHLPSLYNISLRITNNQNDAESLVKDTLHKAYHTYDLLQINSDFRHWIFHILVKTFVTSHGKVTNQPPIDNYSDLEEFFLFKRLDEEQRYDKTSKNELIENLDQADIKGALDNLPYQFKLVVILSDIEGFAYNEIANIIDIQLKTVSYRLYIGRKLLQKYFWKNTKLFNKAFEKVI